MDFYTANYKIRYLPIDWKRWSLEISAFQAIVDLCKSQGLPLLVVEMPLSKLNRDLLPAEFIIKHREQLTNITGASSPRSNNVILLDLFADDKFTLNDYMDTVHLRSKGGMKLANDIAKTVKNFNLLKREALGNAHTQ